MKFNFLLLFILLSQWGYTQNEMLIPPTISGENIDLTLAPGTHEFFEGFTTNTLGINGDVLGPTIILNQDELVNFTVNNQIGETTTIHWHGMHVSAINDGGPHTTIANGENWQPSFTVLDKAATYWYHPHLHEHTNDHVLRGLAGLIIVKDSEEEALDLPRTYGVDDIPLVVQTKTFDANKQIVLGESALDTEVLANATRNAFYNVPAQIIRLRLLNGASQRIFEFGLSNNMTFHQIATDGGLLGAPVALTRLRLAPGERAEILIDLSSSEGESIYLKSFGSELPNNYYGAGQLGMNAQMTPANYNDNPLNGSDFEVLELVVGAPNGGVTTMPNTLVTQTPLVEGTEDVTRTFQFQPATFGPQYMVNGPFVINGNSFDLDVVNEVINLGDTEIWSLQNSSMVAHPFHIHDVQFYILERNGSPVPANEQGRKDVVVVPPQNGSVKFIAQFLDFADDEVPYMYHCHMLTHEDAGMMGQFRVEGIPTATNDFKKSTVKIVPNPTTGYLTLSNLNRAHIELIDLQGRILKSWDTKDTVESLDIFNFESGIYFLKIKDKNRSKIVKIFKK